MIRLVPNRILSCSKRASKESFVRVIQNQQRTLSQAAKSPTTLQMSFNSFFSSFSDLPAQEQLRVLLDLRTTVESNANRQLSRVALKADLDNFTVRMSNAKIRPSTSQLPSMHRAELITADRTASGFPVDLRVPAFRKMSPEVLNEPLKDLEIDPTVFQLFSAIRRFYDNEDAKVMAILPHLRQYLNGKNWNTFEAQTTGFEDLDSDVMIGRVDIATYILGIGMPLLIVEVKKEEHSSSKSDSPAQAGAYYLHFLECKQNLIVSNFPCFVLTIRAAAISSLGMVYGDRASRSETNIVACSHLAAIDISRSDSLRAFAWFLHNLKEGMRALQRQHLQDLVASLQPNYSSVSYRFPDFTTFQFGSETISFHYTGLTAAGQFVFKAFIETSPLPPGIKSSDIIVKFINTKQYPVKIHQAMAEKGFAPLLYACIDLELRGWKVIIMEDAEKSKRVIKLDGEVLTEAHRRKEMEMLVYLHHHLLSCHGDLRNHNLIFYKGTVDLRVLDFDWAGRVGEAKYPCNINDKVGWAEGVIAGGLMRFEHDRHFFEKRYQHLSQLSNNERRWLETGDKRWLTTTSTRGEPSASATYQEAPAQGMMEPMEESITEEEQNLAGLVHAMSPFPTSEEEAQASKKVKADETLPIEGSKEESVDGEDRMENVRATEAHPVGKRTSLPRAAKESKKKGK